MTDRRALPWLVLGALVAAAAGGAVGGAVLAPVAVVLSPQQRAASDAFTSGHPLIATVTLTGADDPGWLPGPLAPVPAAELARVGRCLGRPVPAPRVWVVSPVYASSDGLYTVSSVAALQAGSSAVARRLGWYRDPEYPVCQAAATRRALLPTLPLGTELDTVAVKVGPAPAGTGPGAVTVTTTLTEQVEGLGQVTKHVTDVVEGRGPVVVDVTATRHPGTVRPSLLRFWADVLWRRAGRAARVVGPTTALAPGTRIVGS